MWCSTTVWPRATTPSPGPSSKRPQPSAHSGAAEERRRLLQQLAVEHLGTVAHHILADLDEVLGAGLVQAHQATGHVVQRTWLGIALGLLADFPIQLLQQQDCAGGHRAAGIAATQALHRFAPADQLLTNRL